MANTKNIKSNLSLQKLVFEKIEFTRKGFKNEQEPVFKINATINKKQNEEIYKVLLTLIGDKQDEYSLEISLAGFFSFDSNTDLTETQRTDIISKNAIAIIMPYLRSEVSLLTAQPEVDCVTLPPFNVNKIFE